LDGLSHNAHILISVWDYDKTKNNDLIGVAVVAFRDIIDSFCAGSNSLPISETLLQNGLVMGKFSASIKLRVTSSTGSQLTASQVREAFDSVEKKPLSKMRDFRAGSCCTVM